MEKQKKKIMKEESVSMVKVQVAGTMGVRSREIGEPSNVSHFFLRHIYVPKNWREDNDIIKGIRAFCGADDTQPIGVQEVHEEGYGECVTYHTKGARLVEHSKSGIEGKYGSCLPSVINKPEGLNIGMIYNSLGINIRGFNKENDLFLDVDIPKGMELRGIDTVSGYRRFNMEDKEGNVFFEVYHRPDDYKEDAFINVPENYLKTNYGKSN